MLLECALLQECRDEYYTVDLLNALFKTIPETCIVEFLWEAEDYSIWYDVIHWLQLAPRLVQYDQTWVII